MWLYKLYRKIRGRWVILFDYDGEENRRRAYQFGYVWLADRFPFGIATVVLRDDGSTLGACYVERWSRA
jgi:hypothetical protein